MQGDYRPFERPQAQRSLVMQIALGVFLGSLAAAAVMWAVVELRVRWEVHQAAELLHEHTRRVQQELEQANEKNRLHLLAEQAAKEQASRAATEQQRAADVAKQAAQAEVARRESAWSRYYKPSPGCALAGQSIECANEFIRAKRSFEQKYADGLL